MNETDSSTSNVEHNPYCFASSFSETESTQTPNADSTFCDFVDPNKAESPLDSFVRNITQTFFGTHGRVNRSGWLFHCITAFVALVALNAGIVSSMSTCMCMRPALPVFGFGMIEIIPLELLVVLWCWGAISVQRLHDFGKSGFWILPLVVLSFAVLCGAYVAPEILTCWGSVFDLRHILCAVWILYSLILFLTPGSKEPNRFGAPIKPRKSIFNRLFDFKGRSSGAELLRLFTLVIIYGLAFLALGTGLIHRPHPDYSHVQQDVFAWELIAKFFTPLWFMIVFVPIIGVCVRRLHDLGKSGVSIITIGLFIEATYLGFVALLYFPTQKLYIADINFLQYVIWIAVLIAFSFMFGFKRAASRTNRLEASPE